MVRWRLLAHAEVEDSPEPPMEFGVEFWGHVHPNGREYAAYYGLDRPAPDRSNVASFIERYVRNEIGVYVDITWAAEGTAFDHHHAAALLYWPREWTEADDLDPRLVEADCERGALRDRADSWEEAVLVDIRQFLQLPEGIKDGVLPAVVGLQASDTRSRGARHALHFVGRSTPLALASPKSLFGLENGKCRVLGLSLREEFRRNIVSGELVGEMVQGRTQAMDAIPNQDTKVWAGPSDVDGSADDPAFVVKLSRHSVEVGLPKLLDRQVDISRVLIGTVDLGFKPR